MLQELLRDSDWANMRQSVELRVPFLHVPLLRASAPWVATHPALTKTALALQLPAALVTSFTTPVRSWRMGDKAEVKEPGYRGWALYVHGLHMA